MEMICKLKELHTLFCKVQVSPANKKLKELYGDQHPVRTQGKHWQMTQVVRKMIDIKIHFCCLNLVRLTRKTRQVCGFFSILVVYKNKEKRKYFSTHSM